ncbi:MAG: sporulation protein [Chloroflexi bacterium]|nr:sporulation protein [Chloroflexota bacterium]
MTGAEDEARHAAENDLVSRLLEGLAFKVGGQAGAQAVFGDSVERDGITVIPVARVRWGVGGGGGAGPEGSGSGGGGGVAADPIGYIEVTSSGAIFRPIPRSFGPGAVLGQALALAIVLRALARFRR